jgi:hypothetical protein
MTNQQNIQQFKIVTNCVEYESILPLNSWAEIKMIK